MGEIDTSIIIDISLDTFDKINYMTLNTNERENKKYSFIINSYVDDTTHNRIQTNIMDDKIKNIIEAIVMYNRYIKCFMQKKQKYEYEKNCLFSKTVFECITNTNGLIESSPVHNINEFLNGSSKSDSSIHNKSEIDKINEQIEKITKLYGFYIVYRFVQYYKIQNGGKNKRTLSKKTKNKRTKSKKTKNKRTKSKKQKTKKK